MTLTRFVLHTELNNFQTNIMESWQLIDHVHTRLKASDAKRHPVQDAKNLVKLYILFNTTINLPY